MTDERRKFFDMLFSGVLFSFHFLEMFSLFCLLSFLILHRYIRTKSHSYLSRYLHELDGSYFLHLILFCVLIMSQCLRKCWGKCWQDEPDPPYYLARLFKCLFICLYINIFFLYIFYRHHYHYIMLFTIRNKNIIT